MRATLGRRLQYYFDDVMSHGTPALIGLLGICSLGIILVAAIVIALLGIVRGGDEAPLGLGEAIWSSLMHTLDAGTLGGAEGTEFRWVMLFVTIGGIFIVSALIGVLNNGLEAQMDRLRKGRSVVLETGHIVILGWSAQIFTIVNELMVANENQRGARIVVLAGKDKVEMEDELRDRVRSRGRTRVICRSGNPVDPTDVEIASPHTARAIVVLPPESADADADAIKAVLAITNNPNRRPEAYHVVTQIRDPKNMVVMELIGANDRVQAILTGEPIARIVAQTSRQAGLSVVYTELLDFDGDEIYFARAEALAGRTYGEALLAYEDSAVMGLRLADGAIRLNPPMGQVIGPGDRVIALSADDDTVRLAPGRVPVEEALMRADARPRAPGPERCLILGWNRAGATIARELEHYVAPGSHLTVIADGEAAVAAQVGGLANQTLEVRAGDTTDRDLLDALGVAEYDHVIVLADATLEPQAADAKTLVTLLHLRDMAEKDATPFSIVSEMLDLRNRELAAATKVDDFIVSEHLISLMLAQLVENPELQDVFADIFDPEGAEIYLKPVGDYVAVGQPVGFATVVEAARRRGETALGYRIAAQARSGAKPYGVHTNPPKSARVTFAAEDKVIVIAES